jgi:hypothetical protein
VSNYGFDGKTDKKLNDLNESSQVDEGERMDLRTKRQGAKQTIQSSGQVEMGSGLQQSQ